MNSGIKITEELLDRVIHGMENQEEKLFLNPQDGSLRSELENDGSLIPLPKWEPSDGYLLMERFVAELPNSVLRNELMEILNSGKGVFRRFKNILKEKPEIERIWKQFKKHYMRRKAISWFNRWVEALNLELLGPEPEETEGLMSMDFLFRSAEREDMKVIAEWNQKAGEEESSGISGFIQNRFWREREFLSETEPEEILKDIIVAETPSGEPAGFIWFRIHKEDEAEILQLYTIPEFRGFGLGRTMVEKAMEKIDSAGAVVNIQSVRQKGSLSVYLEECGFVPCLSVWRRENPAGE